MKKSIFVGAAALAVTYALMNIELSQARERIVKKQSTILEEETIRTTQAAPESVTTYRRSSILGVGFSTVSSIIPGTSALTATVDLTRLDTIQGLFSIPATSPFNLGAAALYKRTIAEARGAGFHLGGGLGLANLNTPVASTFNLNFTAIGGFHFELPGIPQIMVHLDGGPTFNLTTSPGTTNFQVAALSPALGASVLYLF